MTILVTESLATKYRPKTLKHLVGQDAVRLAISGMVKTKKFPHAIMITGNSGVGKTTVAQLIGRYVNCENLNACGKCESCTRVNHPDFLELNVGESGGKEDIKNIVNSSKMMPKYNKRIIFLDEAHLLTKQAEGSFLVPLENPSKNTIFILATTNPEKVLPTIIGRCVKLELRPIKEEDMVKRLLAIAESEGIDFLDMDKGKESIELLASLTNGQMRDAIQMLENLIFTLNSGEKIDPKTLMSKYVASFSVDIEKTAASLLYALLAHDLKGILKYSVKSESPRYLLSKTRWLINYLLEEYVSKASYMPVAARYFIKLTEKNPIKIKYSELLVLQSILTRAEITMNTLPVDENVILSSAFGEYIQSL